MEKQKQREYYNYLDRVAMESTLSNAIEAFDSIKLKQLKVAEDEINTTSKFIWEINYIMKQLAIVPDVYNRDDSIHPRYVLEKLNTAKRLLEHTINFFEHQQSNKKGE